MNKEELLAWVLDTYGTEPDYPWDGTNAVLRHADTRKWYAVVLAVPEQKLGFPGDRIVDVLNVKCDPLLIGGLRQQPGYAPAYHMNKDSWISILLDGTVPAEEIQSLVEFSYQLTRKKKKGKIHDK